MTVSTTNSKVQYNGDGISTSFSFSYKALEQDNVQVILTNTTSSTLDGISPFASQTLTLDSDYLLSLSSPGGTVDFTGGSSPFGAPSSGIRITLSRNTDLTQEIDYIANDPFPAETHEEGLDRSAIRDQEIVGTLDRLVRLQEGDKPINLVLPLNEQRKDKVLAFDDNGKVVAKEIADLSSTFDTNITNPSEDQVIERSGNQWVNENPENLSVTVNSAKRTLGERVADKQVASISDLQGLNTSKYSTGDIVYMRSRTSTGDGGGGVFVWNGSDLSTEVGNDLQSGFYVAPNSDTTGASGAWVRQTTPFANGVVAAEWFGAIADGNTDSEPGLNAANDFLTAEYGGGSILLSTGTYIVQDFIKLDDNISVAGQGTGATTLKAGVNLPDDNEWGIIGNKDHGDGNDDITLDGFTVDGSRADGVITSGVRFEGTATNDNFCNRLRLTNLRALDCADMGLQTNSMRRGYCANLYADNCGVDGGVFHNFKFTRMEESIVKGVISVRSRSDAIKFNIVSNSIIDDILSITPRDAGFEFAGKDPNDNPGMIDNVVSNVRVRGTTDTGANAENGANIRNALRCVFSNVHIEKANSHGLLIGPNCSQISINNIVLDSNGDDGVQVFGDEITINGGTMRNNADGVRIGDPADNIALLGLHIIANNIGIDVEDTAGDVKGVLLTIRSNNTAVNDPGNNFSDNLRMN